MILLPTHYNMKPPPSARLITGHPLGDIAAGFFFDERCGLTAYDTGENRNDGAFTGNAAWADGKTGRSIYLNGGTDGIATTWIPKADSSVSIWIKPMSNIGTLGIWSAGLNGHRELMIYNGRYNFFGSGYDLFPAAAAVNIGVWDNVTCVCSESGDYARLYLNGELLGEDLNINAAVLGTFHIGFKIRIPLEAYYDHCLCYDRAICESEVKKLFYEPFCMLFRRGQPVAFDTGAPPPVTASVFGSLVSDYEFIKYNEGIFAEV